MQDVYDPDVFLPFQVLKGSVASALVMDSQNETNLDPMTANLFAKVFANVLSCRDLRNFT